MASTFTTADEELITLLARAADGKPYREQKSPKADGLFPSGAKGKALATAARERGLVEACPDPDAPPPKGKKAPKLTHIRLTKAGREQVLRRLSPKDALESLHRFLQSATPGAAPPAESPTLASQVSELRAAIDRLHGELAAADDRRRTEAADWRQLLGVLETKVREAVEQTRELATPVGEPAAATGPDTTRVEDEIVRFVSRWAEDRGYGCQVDELKSHLDTVSPGLPVGGFHDLLRGLHDAGRIRLSGWGQTLDEIPHPELALFVSHKVMYYVHPGDRAN